MVETENGTGKGRGDRTTNSEPNYLKFSKYAAAALEFPSTVLGGMFLGYLLDGYFNLSPWLTTILTFVALIGAFARLFQLLRYLSRDKK
jgi:F0F1-type ATP synthase assembly protein I